MDNNSQTKNEYSHLMKLYFYVVDNSLKGRTFSGQDIWLSDTEPLSIKLFNHINSIQYLSLGTPLFLPGEETRVHVDYSSVLVVTRAAFETFLTFCYIFCDSIASYEEKRFRHTIWSIRALQDRQKFFCVSTENRPKLEEEKKLLNELINKVKSSSIFTALNKGYQKEVLKGIWRYGKGWADLAEIAGFNKRVFKDVYSHLCSYAHSGGLSALQIRHAASIAEQQGMTTSSSQYGLILMSHFIISFCELFPEAKNTLEKDNELKRLAEKWHVTWKEEAFLAPFSNNHST
jgi:hypothetical protein